MYWVIGGVLVVILAVAAFITIAFVKEKHREQRVRKLGKPFIGAIVMANHQLADPDGWIPEAAGTVVFGFYAPTPKLRAALQMIVTRAYALYEAENLDRLSPACRQFAETIENHDYTDKRRYRVPQEICGSLEIYAADLWINRSRLSKTWSDDRMIACLITGTSEGEIYHLPLNDCAAINLYDAVRGS
jgi:hypothetical protein